MLGIHRARSSPVEHEAAVDALDGQLLATRFALRAIPSVDTTKEQARLALPCRQSSLGMPDSRTLTCALAALA